MGIGILLATNLCSFGLGAYYGACKMELEKPAEAVTGWIVEDVKAGKDKATNTINDGIDFVKSKVNKQNTVEEV